MTKASQIIIICIAGIIFYFNSLGNDFVWDDGFLVRDNPNIRSVSQALSFGFSHNLTPGEILNYETDYYRPLQVVSYAMDFSLWQAQPFGYHLTNLLLHLSNAILIYLFVSLICALPLVSFLCALFFAVHPINTEAVSYISGRADLLAAFFILSSFCLFILGRRTKEAARSSLLFIACLTCLFLAILSKEYALAIPFLFFIFDYSFGYLNKRAMRQYLSFLVPVAIYLWLRHLALGVANFFPSAKYGHFLTDNFPERLAAFFKSILVYIRILILPVNLHMERSFSRPDIYSYFGAMIFFILISAGFYLFAKQRKDRPVSLFLFSWFFILLFSQSYLLLPNVIISEHFLYLASLSFFFICAYLIYCLVKRWKDNPKNKRLVIIVAGIIICFWGSLTSIHNLNWKDNITFYKWTLKFAPYSLRIHFSLASEYMRIGRYDLAFRENEITKELFASIYGVKGLNIKAPKEVLEAMLVTHYNLAVYLLDHSDYEAAKNEYKEALAINPGNNKIIARFDKLFNK